MVSVKLQKQKPLPIGSSPLGKEGFGQTLVGTAKGLCFFQDYQQRLELENHSIEALAHNAEGIWVVVDANSVWHRNWQGKWHRVGTVKDLRVNCLLPLAGAVLVGTSEAHLGLIADGSVQWLDRFEAVEERSQWYTPWGGPPAVRSLAVSAADEFYVNVHVGGILRSQDQGRSWQPTIALHSDVHQVLTLSTHPHLVLAATAQGLAMSWDGGDSWQFQRTGLHATYARAVAVSGNQVLMSVSDGPHGGRAALYRLPLDQSHERGSFQKCQLGLPEWFSDNINTKNLVASGLQVAFGTSDGDVFVSDDAGQTWQQLSTGLPPIQCLGLV